jgi:hypothetical protein
MNCSWNGVFAVQPENEHARRRRPGRRPGYYALYSWNELKKLGTQVEAGSDCPDLYVTAARGEDGEIALLVSYFNDAEGWNQTQPPEEDFVIDLPGDAPLTAYVVEDGKTFEPVPLPDRTLRLKGNTCALITMR